MENTLNYAIKTKEELLTIIASQAKQIHFLEEAVLAYKHRQFANKSEKLSREQLSFFDEAIAPKNAEKIMAAEEENTSRYLST